MLLHPMRGVHCALVSGYPQTPPVGNRPFEWVAGTENRSEAFQYQSIDDTFV
jgi:hypothetical protein